MTDKINPSTLSGTELLLRQKRRPDTLVTEPLQAPVEAVTKQVQAEDEEASEEAVSAFKAAIELLEAKEHARKIVEAVKQANLNKGKQ
ncbi:hypothetical protein [Pseudomonas sp. S2_F03]